MDYLKLTQNKIDVGEISELVAHESCGAVSLFVGTTRDNFEDKTVLSLEYEAYESMALKAMKNICQDVRDHWSAIKHIAIYHRLGVVPVKEASIVVALSSPHRVDSMLAVQYAMDKLKAMVPVWKKEIYADSENGNKVSISKNFGGVKKLKVKSAKFTLPDIKFIASSIPSHLVQIKADSAEIGRRISSFIAQKRSTLNEINVKEYIQDEKKDPEYSCARVDAVLWKRKDSKSHLKVYKVVNEYGPQLPKIEPREEKPSLVNDKCDPKLSILPDAIAERVTNCETHLNMTGPIPKDIYFRLKAIEDRILQLESVSPEYAHFWTVLTDVNAGPVPKPSKQEVFQEKQKKLLQYPVPKPKPKFTSEDLNRKMEELKRHIEEHRLTNES